MVRLTRWLKHAFILPWRWRLAFHHETLTAIEAAIRRSETLHRGEIRFAIENNLSLRRVWRGVSAWYRATEVFSLLRVWDTEENSGILVYVLLADREVHILADRGINKLVAQHEWDAIASQMREHFARNDFKTGSLAGIELATQLLASHFPASEAKMVNELPDHPAIIKR